MKESWHTWRSHDTPWHTWRSHDTHECVLWHMCESCHTWMSHDTHEWVMSHMNGSWHTWISHAAAWLHRGCWVVSRVVAATHTFPAKEPLIIMLFCRKLTIKRRYAMGLRNSIVLWLASLRMLHPRNPPNREIKIPRYLAAQIQIEILI